MKEPSWVKKEVVLAFHEEILAVHGGISGIREEGLLDSALGRPQHLFAYENPTLFDLAASYAFGIARNHPFLDGNKRAAFVATYVFLGINGIELSATEVDATVQMLALAAGDLPERSFAALLKENSVPAKS